MKTLKLLTFIVLACSIERQIELIRPGAEYTITKGDYDGIEWTDKVQVKPTRLEMDAALLACQAPEKQKADSLDALKSDVRNRTKTADERLDALIKILGLEPIQ